MDPETTDTTAVETKSQDQSQPIEAASETLSPEDSALKKIEQLESDNGFTKPSEDEDFDDDLDAPVDDEPKEDLVTVDEDWSKKYQEAVERAERAERGLIEKDQSERLAAGDLTAGMDPIMAQYFNDELVPKVITGIGEATARIYTPQLARNLTEITSGVVGDIMQTVRDNAIVNGMTPESLQAAQEELDIVEQYMAQAFESPAVQAKLAAMVNHIAVQSGKVVSSDTVRRTLAANTNHQQTKQAAQAEFDAFHSKVQQVEKSLGVKLTDEQKQQIHKKYTPLRAANIPVEEALEDVFTLFQSGLKTGVDAGKQRAAKKSNEQSLQNAHRAGRQPPRQGEKKLNDLLLDDSVSMADIRRAAGLR